MNFVIFLSVLLVKVFIISACWNDFLSGNSTFLLCSLLKAQVRLCQCHVKELTQLHNTSFPISFLVHLLLLTYSGKQDLSLFSENRIFFHDLSKYDLHTHRLVCLSLHEVFSDSPSYLHPSLFTRVFCFVCTSITIPIELQQKYVLFSPLDL